MLTELQVVTTAPATLIELQACLARHRAGKQVPNASRHKAAAMLRQAVTFKSRLAILENLVDALSAVATIEREAQ